MAYHINEKGEPGLCKAEIKCRFGKDNEHFTSPEAARKAFEESMAKKPLQKSISEATLADRKVLPINKASFEKISTFDYSAVERNLETLRNSYAPGASKDYAIEKIKEVRAFRDEQAELLLDRVSAAAEAKYPGSVEEAIKNRAITLNSPLKSLTHMEKSAIYSVVSTTKKTQDAFYKTPASFLPALVSTHDFKAHSRPNITKLIQVAATVHENDPLYTPIGFTPQPRITGRVHSSGVPQMQNVSPQGYDLLLKYTQQKYGDKAKDFWLTVGSDSRNYPKLTDFARAEKEFDKR